MNRIVNRRVFMEAAYAYIRASNPTPQLIVGLCTAFAQMLADDFDGRVVIKLPDDINVIREPKGEGVR